VPQQNAADWMLHASGHAKGTGADGLSTGSDIPAAEVSEGRECDPGESTSGTINGSAPSEKSVFALPYRLVWAVATTDTIAIYDSQQQHPLCVIANLHYSSITDLAWSADGLVLIVSSTDGFCSSVAFEPGELGEAYTTELPLPVPIVRPSVLSAPSAPETAKPVFQACIDGGAQKKRRVVPIPMAESAPGS
jgi:hypothetical protein